MTLKVRWRWIGVFLLWSTLSSVARGEEATSFPDMALLEFLGSWETEEGEWIDPMLFEDGQVDGVSMPEKPDDPQGAFKDKPQAERAEREHPSLEEKKDKGNMKR